VLVTTSIGIFKREKDYELEEGHVKINVFKSYKLIWKILKLPNIRVLAIALLTMKVTIASILIQHLEQSQSILINKL